MSEREQQRRDLILIGGSAGSLEVFRAILQTLPRGFPAAILAVTHQSQSNPGILPWIANATGNLPAKHPVDGELITPGHVYIAPPNQHLIVEGDHIRLTFGPKENRFRPAIDPLFRTAAAAHGPRVIAVILSGLLDDGTLGMLYVKRAGGVCIAQDPDYASARSMPASAIRYVGVDHVLKPDEIAATLLRLVQSSIPDFPAPRAEGASTMSERLTNDRPTNPAVPGNPDVAIAADNALLTGKMPGPPTGMTCPECGGAIWEMNDGGLVHYRCHVGHAYSADSFVADHDDTVEQALWAAFRSLQESAALHVRMTETAQRANAKNLEALYREQAAQAEANAEVLRNVLLRTPRPLVGAQQQG